MASTEVFNASEQHPLLYKWWNDPQLVYLLPAGTKQPLRQIGLTATWTPSIGTDVSGGTYFFLGASIEGKEAAFVRQAREWLAAPGRGEVRLAWFTDPTAPGGPSLSAARGQKTVPMAGPALFQWRNISLVVPAGWEIGVMDSPNPPAFVVTPGTGATPIYLLADWGAVPLPPTVVQGGLTIPLDGPQSRCVKFDAKLSGADLAALGAGLRTFYADPERFDPQEDRSEPFFLLPDHYPLVDPSQTAVAASVSLDPTGPLLPHRTYVSLVDASGAGLPLVSNLRSTLGSKITLTPHGVPQSMPGSGFVVATSPLANTPSDDDPYYLVPTGPFVATAPGQAGSFNLMLGLSGVEYVEVPAGGATITYVPGCAAFASGFAPARSDGPTSLDASVATTSWACVSAVDYFAQPDASVLHQVTQETGLQQFLVYLPLSVGTLQATEPRATTAFPFLPYAEVAPGEESVTAMEAKVIAPTRRAAIFDIVEQQAPADTTPADDGAVWAKTPQGLVAETTPNEWTEVWLAQDVAQQLLKLEGVRDLPADPAKKLPALPLLSALTSNQLFLVVSDADALAQFLTAGQIMKITLRGTATGSSSENWTFDLTPSQWRMEPDSHTLLVFKFADRPLTELAADTSSWAQATAFNTNVDEASDWLASTLQSTEDPTFASIVSNPAWNGILALNVTIAELPGDIEGLMAGVDTTQFRAHHIGFNLTPVDMTVTPPTLQTTSMFALIDYKAPEPMKNDGFDYQFQVGTMKVLFQNSVVVEFTSEIRLQVNALFGEPVASGPPENIVVLKGILQKDGYAFTSASDAPFTINSKVLDSVEIAKAQFVTVDPGTSSGTVQSRFSFWGTIAFESLTYSADPTSADSPDSASADPTTKPFDVFSFGPSNDSHGGLAYSGLSVEMAFPKATPTQATFVFDAGAMAFDMATSTVRSGSLFEHFPLTLKGLVQGKTGMTPATMNYMSLTTPLTQSDVALPWYALDLDLDLGTLGALAAQAGFVASLLLAWAPDPTNYRIFIGLQLPGSSGGSERAIDIEGILKITFQSLELNSPEGQAFVLWLRNVAVSLLGVSFPSGAMINVALLGNPGAGGPALGWLAAYAKQPLPCGSSTTSSGPSPAPALAPGDPS